MPGNTAAAPPVDDDTVSFVLADPYRRLSAVSERSERTHVAVLCRFLGRAEPMRSEARP